MKYLLTIMFITVSTSVLADSNAPIDEVIAPAETAAAPAQDDPFTLPELGATIEEDGVVKFALHAPGKKSVSVIGSFNDWSPNTDPMTADDDGTWTCRIKLPPGVHEYQYLIDGRRIVADPYSHDVTWKDDEGNENWEP